MIFFISEDILLAFFLVLLIVAADLALAVISALSHWWWVFLFISIPRIIYMTKQTDMPKTLFCILETIRTAIFYGILIGFLGKITQTFYMGVLEGMFTFMLEFFLGGAVTLLLVTGGSMLCASANENYFVSKHYGGHPGLKFILGIWVMSLALNFWLLS